jgi:integrase
MNTTSKHKLPVKPRGQRWRVDFRKLPAPNRPDKCKTSGQLTFKTKALADTAAQAAWDDWQSAQHNATTMNDRRRKLAVEAFAILKEYPDAAIVEAARMYRERIGANSEAKTIEEAAAEYLNSLSGSVTELTLKNDYRVKFRHLTEGLGERDMQSVTETDLEQWLDSRKPSAKYRDDIRNRLVTFWEFAIQRRYVKHNAAKGLAKMSRAKRKKLSKIPPAIMEAGEVKRLLDAAADLRGGQMLPYFAVCALCGLRPYEARRIAWEHIHLEQKEIYVPAEATKTGDDREVEMPACLVAWLEQIPADKRRGTLPYTRNGFDTVRDNAGVKDRWQEPKGHDILRHSAASHHFRLHNNAERTGAAMGHDVLTFRKHYKSRVKTRTEAEAYFDVWPEV